MKNTSLLVALIALALIGCTSVGSDPVAITTTFRYTAPGDDGILGQASLTQIRVASSEDDLINNWDSCTIISEHIPWPPGVWDSLEVEYNIESWGSYVFALKVADEVPNWSQLSNVLTIHIVDAFPPSPVGDFSFAD